MRRRVIIVAALALVILFGVIAARVAFEEWRTIATTSVTVRFEVTTEYRIGFALGTGDIAFGRMCETRIRRRGTPTARAATPTGCWSAGPACSAGF